jgi:DNA helicase HerA-like ATPase
LYFLNAPWPLPLTPASVIAASASNSDIQCHLLADKANRHGLITGATGTGKTITLQTMAEGFSRMGVPVFMADIKGDLTGISQAGSFGPKMASRSSQNAACQLPNPSSLPGDAVGCVWRTGPPGARHHQ